jgi:hypothetical protein
MLKSEQFNVIKLKYNVLSFLETGLSLTEFVCDNTANLADAYRVCVRQFPVY